jgi:NADH:ubiquinone oxidoreductase subunit F (NADH-binding)
MVGGFQNGVTNSTIIDSPVDFQRLNYSSSFIGNSLLIILFQVCSLSIYGFLILVEKLNFLSFLKKKCSLESKMKEAK